MTTMTAFEWAALIGAFAWVPHIVNIGREWLAKPKIRVITQPTPELGFSTFGCICNMRVAFVAEHKDLVVTRICLTINHESGDSRLFEWQSVVQKMGHMTHPEVGRMPFEKDHNVLAIKVIVRDVEERFVRFQEASFITRKTELEEIASKKLAHLNQNGPLDTNAFLSSDEMRDLCSFIRQSFHWKAGRYTLRFKIESPSSFDIVDTAYSFSLTPMQIEQLEHNRSNIEQYYRNDFAFADGAESAPTLTWNWAYPKLTKD